MTNTATIVFSDNEEALYLDGKYHGWSYCFSHNDIATAAGCEDYDYYELYVDEDWWYDEANQEWPDDLDDVVLDDV